jgi:hypothetical protein
MGFEARSWPGGELSMPCAARSRRLTGGRSMAAIAGVASCCAAAVLVETNAAMASGAWLAAQMAGPLEWQQAAARTQSCCDLADCVGWCGVTARHRMPQVALASGASTSSRISARASCARRSIAIQFSPRLIRDARKRLHPALVRVGTPLLSAAAGHGRAATAPRRRRPATAQSGQPGCGG